MGLKGDFDESVRAWQDASPLVRIWLILSVFLASGSIASLSETLVKWRGFLVDALNIYKNYVSEPLYSLVSSRISLDVPRSAIDVIVMYLLLATPHLRAAAHRGVGSEQWYESLGMFVGILFVPVYLFAKKGLGVPYFYAIWCWIIYAWISAYWYRKDRATFVLWLVYLVAPFAVVGLVGAVSTAIAAAK
jgi:hypothetical protein